MLRRSGPQGKVTAPASSTASADGGDRSSSSRLHVPRGSDHRLPAADGHLRVDLRCTQLHVPEHRLDVADVGAVLEHHRRHRVDSSPEGQGSGSNTIFRFECAPFTKAPDLGCDSQDEGELVCSQSARLRAEYR
jgi:hypothetical protein